MFSLPRFFPVWKSPRHFLARFPIIGLDIGSSSIKVAEIKPAGKQWHLLHCGIKPLPTDAVVDGQIRQADTVVQAIQDLIAETGITTKRAAISLGGPSVITKKIQLPIMTELDLEDQIVLEAEEYIPFDIEEVCLDFQTMGRGKETMDVLLIACKKELIDSHADVVRQAGLDPRICDLDLFCLSNAYQHFIQRDRAHGPYAENRISARRPSRKTLTSPTSEEGDGAEGSAVVLLNLGSALLNIAILHENGIPGYIRDHAFGGRKIVQECQRHYNISQKEAETLPILATNMAQHRLQEAPTQGQPPPEWVNFQTEIVHPFLEQLLQQVRQAIQFHKTGNPNQSIAGVWISGGCARLPHIGPFIEERLGVPTHMADPFSTLATPRNRWNLELNNPFKNNGKRSTLPLHPNLEKMATQFMVALGLALRGDIP